MCQRLGLCLAFSLVLGLCTAAPAEPVTFRGIPMGVALADFRKMPFPDEAKHPKTRIMCSGDKGLAKFSYFEKPPWSQEMERIGVTACSFYTPTQHGNPYRNGVDLANIGGWDTTFHFSPSSFPDGTRDRLYLITVTPKAETYQTLVDALAAKYGKPETTSEKIKNRMGAEFVDEIATWRSEGSTILVKRYNGRIDQALVAYSQDEITKVVGDAGAGLAVENAKKL
jgi:hypothetical protein